MRVIERHEPEKEVICTNCKSKLAYEQKDVKRTQVHMNEFENNVTCEVCKKKIKVDSW